jgi:hypothetical protein
VSIVCQKEPPYRLLKPKNKALQRASNLARVGILSFAGCTKATEFASNLIFIIAKLCKIVVLATEIIRLGRAH